jgi:7,8-dihydroneopterin aldolase/epimerase/oxygenase
MTTNSNTNIYPLLQPSAGQEDVISVFVHDVIVMLRVGVYAFEEKKPQRVRISVEAQTTLNHRFIDYTAQDLNHTINYELLRNYICDVLPAEPQIPLLETAGEMIINHCFTDPRVRAVQVRLEKLDIFPEAAAAGVNMTRYRQG